MVGKENTSNIKLENLCKRFTSGYLYQKLINYDDDAKGGFYEEGIWSTFKSYTSPSAEIFAEEKHKQGGSFSMYGKFLFTSNEMPQTTDSTSAITNRLIFVPLTNEIKKKDVDFIDNINENDIQYLINLSIEGIKRVQKHQWEFGELPPASQRVMQEFKKTINSAFQFVNDIVEGRIEINDDYSRATFNSDHLKQVTNLKELYDFYKIWCADEGIQINYRFKKKRFGEELEKTGKIYLIKQGQVKVKWR